ncbi:unnamed protein product [Danaus chrysippus]|uniref:NADH dehydrogenase [ubiquinone] 1 alpha subcomplex subunit 11 n=1 Tax=Danaus chrysippus TaxID=151541 RepID=A0A8J2QLQ9_9NEOP|nr:unnamed protein product [Danaus chrysippus]
MLVTTRYGAMAGLFLSTYDVLMYSHATGLGNMLRRYAYHTVPLALTGATFAAVANGVQHLRKRDDPLNYFIGGVACGPILAYYFGSYYALFVGGLCLGIAGAIKKDAVDNEFDLLPQVKLTAPVDGWRRDYTLVQDPRDILIHTCGKENEK